MKRKVIAVLISIVIIFTLTVLLDFKGHGNNEVYVVIPKGSGASEIVGILKEKKIISYGFLFRLYLSGSSESLQSGYHLMRTSMGYADALAELKKIVPMYKTVKVTIPEGFELREIAALLEEKGIVSKSDFLSELQNGKFDYDFLPRGNHYEGYLFPATYDLSPEMTPHQIIEMMLGRFDIMLTDEYKARANELGYSINDIVTMASIIEREAALPAERPIISSVFYNRLNIGMKLQSCATVEYILEKRKSVLSVDDTKIDSPYNTYLHPGLPPSPIASPGEESFKAALYPADTDYLYFVADGSGGHRFSKTYEEHLSNQ